ncbi:MAG TPA: hybrid sensor histidine kinase/response regulator [Cyanothece sp. UBA12306]|nr:hybrid sensor histidine kinase/response regulator [Cyanothece sp. UBA12306]
MINDSDIYQQAYQYFLDEIPGLLETIEQELLALTKSDSQRSLIVNELMRATHTLKGGAANVGLEIIETIAHSLEDILKALYHPELIIDSAIQNLLFESYECLRLPLMAQLTEATINDQEILERSQNVFAKLHHKLDNYLQDQNAFPSSEELGIDVIQAFFNDVVPQRLQTITDVLQQAEEQQIIDIVETQLEVFLSLGESLNLPGFQKISQITIEALNKHPEAAKLITQTALEDFQKAQQQILEGDRTIGGEPSDTLLKLAHGEEINQHKVQESIDELLVEKKVIGQKILTNTHASADNLYDKFSYNVKKNKSFINQNVRVKLEGLEKLNHIVGELVISQNKTAIKEQKIQASIEELINDLYHNQQAFYQLNDFVDGLLILSEYSQSYQNQSLSRGASNVSLDLTKSSLKSHYNNWLKSDAYVQLSEKIKKSLELITRSTSTAESLKNLTKESNQTFKKQQRILSTMRDELIETRMSPLGNLFSRFSGLIEQLSTTHNKSVELKLKGQHILVDKAIEQNLYDPLLHLVRNAFDHGIEPPEIRQQLGKSATGLIEICAYHQGSRTIIEVRDDGQGLNFQNIKDRAIKLNLITPEEIETISDAQLLEFLFEPGFSTSSQVNEISGRGVGLDVVRSQLQTLKGKIAIESRQNQGTTFSLQIPLTLSIAKLMVCQAGEIVYSLLPDVIEKIILPQSKDIKIFKGRKVLYWQTETDSYNVPLRKLSELINYRRNSPNQSSKLSTDNQPFISPILLLRHHQGFLGLEVDQVLGEQELVIRPLGTALNPPNYVYGCSILSDNRLSLVIDGGTLVNQTQIQTPESSVSSPQLRDKSQDNLLPNSWQNSHVLLVVDDSLSLRQTITLTLQKVGYRVLQAGDGLEALEELERLKGINLVVCDLDMPRMNGFEFLKAVRQHPELSHLPVITLTSHDSEPYRQLAKQLGTTAYLTKPYTQEELLKTVIALVSDN